MFERWYERATVRVGQQPEVREEETDSYLFYPPELMGVLDHEDLLESPFEFRQALSLNYLNQYMHFTTVLEQVVVLPVTTAISLNRCDVSFGPELRSGAFKITTDEAWHAQSAYDYTESLASATGVAPVLAPPAFEERLKECLFGLGAPESRLLRIFSAVVSETLISSLLADIPHDRRILPSAREVVADHAKDEAHHNVFFRAVLEEIWPQLDLHQQWTVGSRIPTIVNALLDADLNAEVLFLSRMGFKGELARAIVQDSPRSKMTSSKQRPARDTISAFGRVGAFHNPKLAEHLLSAGFLDERSDARWLKV